MKRLGALPIGLAALVAAACAVDPVAEVGHHRSLVVPETAPHPRLPHLPGEDGAPAILGVRDVLLLANERNETLAIAGEDYLRTLIDRRRAVAPFLPSLFLAPSYIVRDDSGTGGGADGDFDVPLVANFTMSPKSDVANVLRADAEIARKRALLFDAQDTLLIDVARTLFEVLRAERAARVLEDSLVLQEARVEDVRARRDAGFARPLDVSLSEANAADARVDLLEARRQTITGRLLLSFLAGVDLSKSPLDGTIEIPTGAPAEAAADDPAQLEAWLARARRDRQDVGAAHATVAAALQSVEIASGQWWPSLRVDLAAFLSRQSDPTDQDWTALFQLSMPLFDAGRIHDDVRDSLSLLREARMNESLVERGARRDVEVAWENLRASRERVVRLTVRLAAAREAFDQADSLYDVGLATNLERLAAQNEQLASELALESAELDTRIFWLDLLRTAGALNAWVGLERPPPLPAATEVESDRAEAR